MMEQVRPQEALAGIDPAVLVALEQENIFDRDDHPLSDCFDRYFVKGVGWKSWKAPSADVQAMTATLDIEWTPYHDAGTHILREADGEDLGTYVDPRLAYTVTCVRTTSSTIPAFQADFRRVSGSGLSHAYVVFYWGDPSATVTVGAYGVISRYVRFGSYTASVTGDFTMSATTPDHYIFARWRLCSWGQAAGYPGLWPFPLTATSTLISENLIQTMDAALGTAVAGTPGYGVSSTCQTMMYTPMSDGGLRRGWGNTSEDTCIGLYNDQAAEYFATGNATALSELLSMAEGAHSFQINWRDPATGALIDHVGATRQYYAWHGVSSWNSPEASFNSTMYGCSLTGPVGTVFPNGCTVIDQYGTAWPFGSGTIGSTGTITNMTVQLAVNSNTPYLPPNNSTSTTFQVNGTATAFPGVTFTFSTASGHEGVDNMSPAANHACSGSFCYAAAILTRDPWHIEGMQSAANYWDLTKTLPGLTSPSGNCDYNGTTYAQAEVSSRPSTVPSLGSSWSIGWSEVRFPAWKMRDLAQAILVTPPSTVSWLLPQSSFQTCLDQCHVMLMYRINNPWNAFAVQNYQFVFVLDGQFHVSAVQLASVYWEDYFLLSMLRVMVADPTWIDFMNWYIQGAISRLTGSSGWCPSVPTWYTSESWCETPTVNAGGQNYNTGPIATSWADAWAINEPLFQSYGANPPLSPCPGVLTYPGGSSFKSYYSNFYAAMNGFKQLGTFSNNTAFANAQTYMYSLRNMMLSQGHGAVGWRQCIA